MANCIFIACAQCNVMHVIFVHSKQTRNCPKYTEELLYRKKKWLLRGGGGGGSHYVIRRKGFYLYIYIYIKEEDGTCSYSSHQNRQQALRDVSLFL